MQREVGSSACMALGGLAPELHPTHKLGFSGQKGISEYSGGAVLCPGSAGVEEGALLTLLGVAWRNRVSNRRLFS